MARLLDWRAQGLHNVARHGAGCISESCSVQVITCGNRQLLLHYEHWNESVHICIAGSVHLYTYLQI